MLENYSTTVKSSKPLTIEDLKESMACINSFKYPEIPKYKKSWFTKIMNKFGWYRQYEIIVIDQSKFRTIWDNQIFNEEMRSLTKEESTKYENFLSKKFSPLKGYLW